MSKSRYMTRQRRALMNFFSRHPDEQLSAQEIAAALQEYDVSQSAVYRNLTALEEQGLVRRSRQTDGREQFYQFIGSETCRNCIHLSCTRCGRTFHMDTDEADAFLKTVAERDGFAVDKSETVLYGVCETCQRPD